MRLDNYNSAQYTEYLRDYLYDNELPRIFDEVPALAGASFKQLFRQHYLLREIGFETEEIFKLQLENQALLIVPHYKARFDTLETLKNKLFISEATSNTDNVNKSFTAPLGSADEPISDNNLADASTSEGNITTTATPAGKTNIDLYADYVNKINNLHMDLLKEFDKLFIQLG